MKRLIAGGLAACMLLLITACAANDQDKIQDAQAGSMAETEKESQVDTETMFTTETKITDVINDTAFGDYGRLIFPVESGYYSGDTLGKLKLTWYNNIDPDTTVEIVNYMKSEAAQGNTIFYDIYTEEEKTADPDKEDTGLFFFKGFGCQKVE